jgi:hypothetical protein
VGRREEKGEKEEKRLDEMKERKRNGMAWHGMAWHGMACIISSKESRVEDEDEEKASR